MTDQLSFDLALKKPPRILVFDLETLRDATEVGGWSNVKEMGMACGVVYDSMDGEYHVYEESGVDKLIEHLKKGDLVVGFNHVRFDYTVLSKYTAEGLHRLCNFDILQEVEKRLGHRLKLNSLVTATLGDSKSADGYQSLLWVKQGRMDLVKEYCKKDVEVTKRLFDYGLKEGRLFYVDREGERVQMRVEWNIPQFIEHHKSLMQRIERG